MESVLNILAAIPWWAWILLILVLVFLRDVFVQKRYSVVHNYPIIGHFRYFLISIGPELRQYLVAGNREERPFNRIERNWIDKSSRSGNNYEAFGTDSDIYAHQHIFINNSMIPFKLKEDHPNISRPHFLPAAKVMGLFNGRRRPYRPASIINVSAMSFGALSARAVESLNLGCKLANAYHNTGEGGLSPYHRNGADVVFHFGTGYFGVRDSQGNFSMEKLIELVEANPFIRAIEIKLSQGAKPGKGGVLPAAKISREIAGIRGVVIGKDVISPPGHSAFSTVAELMDFIEDIAEATGLPVGIKAAIGKLDQWEQLADLMHKTGKGPDFIAVDGGEGGTGAAPHSFADHVSLPFVYGFSELYKLFQKRNLTERIVFIGSGKLGFPAMAAMALGMGVDVINVAREAMMSIGCIQAQLCHTNRCPSGVATQNKWRQKGIHVPLKSEMCAQYFKTFKKELLEITRASGYEHPCQYSMEDIEINADDMNITKNMSLAYQYKKEVVDFEGMESLLNCPYLGGGFTKS